MDFDDLLGNTVELFRRHPDVLAHYQQRFRTSSSTSTRTPTRPERAGPAAGAEHRNVCVVGDSDQSIYRFRGADIRNILEFEDAFPDATVILLEQNYRSTQTILDAANAVIANNLGRKPKELWTDRATASRSCATTPTTRPTRPSGWPGEIAHLHDGGTSAGATSRSSTAPTPRAGCSRSTSCGRHPLQGHRRHPLLRPREVKDASPT
jgi:DNA helicase II / ATP-dependent DNA helicase PcrA